MQKIKTLIDKASKVCGSDTALACRMGVKVQVISMLRHGRTITPETAAELADIAGESVKLAVYQAMIERAKGTRREGALREILGKSLLAGVTAMLLFSYTPEVKAATANAKKLAEVLTNYTSWNMALRWFRQLFSRRTWQPARPPQTQRRTGPPSAMQRMAPQQTPANAA